jgi:CubicO group peptidase (beta-lactamase class C family)
MLLNGGSLGTARILSPAAVERMRVPSTGGLKDVRGLGWDIDSTDSANRGDLFPVGSSFGHTGWTGTSLWLDPHTKGYVIFLSNRVHPDGTGDVVALRGEIASIAAAAISEGRK